MQQAPSLELLKERQEIVDRASFFLGARRFDELAPIDILKHNSLHLVKLVAKVAAVCERFDHNQAGDLDVLRNEVIPDLLIYCLQFANALGVDLDSAYTARLSDTLNKYPHTGAANA